MELRVWSQDVVLNLEDEAFEEAASDRMFASSRLQDGEGPTTPAVSCACVVLPKRAESVAPKERDLTFENNFWMKVLKSVCDLHYHVSTGASVSIAELCNGCAKVLPEDQPGLSL